MASSCLRSRGTKNSDPNWVFPDYNFTDIYKITRKDWSGTEEMSHSFSRPSVKFQRPTIWRFGSHFSVSGRQLQFQCTAGYKVTYKASRSMEEVLYVQCHPWNFKVTQADLIWFEQNYLAGRSHQIPQICLGLYITISCFSTTSEGNRLLTSLKHLFLHKTSTGYANGIFVYKYSTITSLIGGHIHGYPTPLDQPLTIGVNM